MKKIVLIALLALSASASIVSCTEEAVTPQSVDIPMPPPQPGRP